MTKNEKYIVDMYVRYFGRAADAATIADYAADKKTSVILKNIIADADAEKSDLDTEAFVNNAFQNLFGRNATTKEMNKYSKVIEKGKNLPINSIYKSAAKADKDVYKNKLEVAAKYAELGGKGDFDLSKISKGNSIDLKTITTLADLDAAIAALPENSSVPSAFDGKTYNLTTGVDTLTGTNKDDTFLATNAETQFSIADSIDGGKGFDTLKLIDSDNTIAGYTLAIPAAASIKNIEAIDIIGNAAVTADSTSIDGVTHLYTTSTGANTSTAAATTNINATATGAAAVAEAIAVNGGKDVTVVSKNNALDTITVGGTTAAAGKVSVTSEGSAVGGVTLGAITVTGGTEITVNQYGKNAVNTTNTGGAIIVTGNEKTTTVTVNQSAVATAAADVVGYVAGAVTVNDENTASTTLADTIETVTVKNAGVVVIDSGALKTLNLEGTITSVTASDATVKTGITAVDTLALNLKGVTTTAITADADVKTLNIASSKDASTVTTLTSAGATAINVSGDAALTVTNLGAGAANQVITVTNTAGVTIGNVLGNDVTFTGGAGADSVIIGATTKTIDMGAGNDTVSIAALPTVGSINGGAGDDKLVVTGAISTALAAEPKITGFEILQVATAAGGTTHNAHTLKALEVANTNTAGTTFTNVAAGVGLTVLTAQAATTVNLLDTTGTADVFNLTLSNATVATQAAGTVTVAGVETINITTVDAGTAANVAATVDTITLVATSATSVTVSGNNGLNITNTGNTAITSFDASGVVGNDTTDTAAGLAVTFASANVTVGAAVSIKGGAGNDTLTGTAQANDTIIGGDGVDTITYNGGIDTLTGGAGNDIFVIGAATVNANTKSIHATITDLAKGDSINLSAVGAIADMTAAQMLAAKVSVASGATFEQALNASIAGNTNDVKWFQFENNTYLVVDGAAAGSVFVDGTDSVIKITGLVDLSTSSISGGSEILVIA
ncbi:beta strand repeat-containing protein [Aliarcobacter cryaerophilus]|uniref:beta strand repeat-containing protein n=1 Tax=Aliarcobacter cryaerophilus TaxID=28198 RepID=UPI00082F41E2|nr:calcium-binding protein [Aliarcobacter cryaerophilus]